MLSGMRAATTGSWPHQPLHPGDDHCIAVLTGWLYVAIPKGLFPQQDTGFIFGQAEERDTSVVTWPIRLKPARTIALADPAGLRVLGLCRHQQLQSVRDRRPDLHQAQAVSQRTVSVGQVIERLRTKDGEGDGRQIYLQARRISRRRPADRTQYQYT